MKNLDIFANFFINSEEKFIRMKDSFFSFEKISPHKWVVNVRGKFSKEVVCFLKSKLKRKLVISTLNSKNGWFHDTRNLMQHIESDYVLFWIEDHINIADVKVYKNIFREMAITNSDHMFISFFKHSKDFRKFKFEKLKFIKTTTLTSDNVKLLKNQRSKYPYMISTVSISKNSFFKKIIYSNNPFLKRWPKKTPFDFEKRTSDKEFLPFNLSFPNFELFASIDDDAGLENVSLISRKLYPKRVERQDISSVEALRKKNKVLTIIKMYSPEFLKSIYHFFKRLYYTFF